jgi:adenosylhomocysteine nucleosidase
MAMPETVIIAALKQEMMPLLRDPTFSWKENPRLHALNGAWETDHAAVVCGGIGARAAARATEDAVREYHPAQLISAGLAGALVSRLHVADIVRPAAVVNSGTGERYDIAGGEGVLVTASEVAGEHGKRLLAHHFHADSADMEAASVAAVAQRHGVPFKVVKSISDEYDFDMPDLNAFITADGRFQTARFSLFLVAHPRLWPLVRQLARNSKAASVQLCRELRNLILQDTTTRDCEPAARPRESQPAR